MTDVAGLGWGDGEEFVWHLVGGGQGGGNSGTAPQQHGAGRTLVRWTFCKRQEVLSEALRRMATAELVAEVD